MTRTMMFNMEEPDSLETRLEKPRAWVVDVATRRVIRKPRENAPTPIETPLAEPAARQHATV